VNERCNHWKEAIPGMISKPLPVEYSDARWLDEAKQAPDISKTDYYKFNQAAVFQLAFVKADLVDAEHIPLLDSPA
jgi:hypothetical protein